MANVATSALASRPRKALVVGAGIAGLSASIRLARAGYQVQVWEQSQKSGGLLAPVSFEGLACDRGTHRIHTGAYRGLFELIPKHAWITRPREGRLVFGSRHVRYPPSAIDLAKGLGLRGAAEMAWGFALRGLPRRAKGNWEKERSQPKGDDEGFENFVRSRVGRIAYRRFYRPYAEKVWGLPPHELSRTVAKERVSTSAPWRILFPRKRPSFQYPAGGMVALVDALMHEATKSGVTFRYQQKPNLEELVARSFGSIIYTGHLKDIVPHAKLEHRGLYLLYVRVPKTGMVTDADTYYTSETQYCFGRVSRPDRFSPDLALKNSAILCVEIPEGKLGPQINFVSRMEEIRTQLQSARIIKTGTPIEAAEQAFMSRVYPLYRRNWMAEWQSAIQWLSAQSSNIILAGRQGLFLHCNADQSLQIATEAVDHVLAGGDAGSWIQTAQRYLDFRVRD